MPSAPVTLDHALQARLQELARDGLDRSLPAVSHRVGTRYRLGDCEVLGFCGNDYLGFGAEDAAPQAALPGATASRLVAGDLTFHRDAERDLADLVGYPDAVLFPSGFQLNVGVLPCLLEEGTTAYSDALNHASLIDGMRLARATIHRLAHRAAPPPVHSAPAWWICESLYSMDGDFAPIEPLHAFAAAGGNLYIDDAHALGLYPQGRGILASHGLRPTVYVGTLGKAFGAAGAFVAGSQTVCHWIRTRARSFVYSTGTWPGLAEHLRAMIPRIRGPEGDERRARLWENIAHFTQGMNLSRPQPSPIFPFLVGTNAKAVTISATLIARGIHVQPIRPPTVPEGTARLRVTMTATHSPAEIECLIATLSSVLADHGLLARDCVPP